MENKTIVRQHVKNISDFVRETGGSTFDSFENIDDKFNFVYDLFHGEKCQNCLLYTSDAADE